MKKTTLIYACILISLGIAFSASAQATNEDPGSTFQNMLVYVYQQNPRIQSERQALKVEDEHVSEAVAGFRPNLSANGDLGKQREKVEGQEWSYGSARDDAVTLSQPIFNGFGTFAQFHAARARVSAERAHLTTVEEQVFLEAITAYLDVVTRQYILMFNRDNRTHLQNYMDAAERRMKAGDGTQTDVAQAQSRFEQSNANVATSEANWKVACATYQRVTGLAIPGSAFPPFPEGLTISAEETVSRAQSAPELFQAAEQERAASQDIDVASSSFWPSLSLRGSISNQVSPVLGLESLRDDSITLNLTIPLYQGGAEYARVREAREQREKARQDRLDTSRFMTERANQTWYNYAASLQIIEASRKTAEAATRALHGVEAEQRQGVRTVQETLDARAEQLNSLIAVVQAEQNARLQAYRLLASTGQLTAESMHLQTALYDPKKHYDKVSDAWVGVK